MLFFLLQRSFKVFFFSATQSQLYFFSLLRLPLFFLDFLCHHSASSTHSPPPESPPPESPPAEMLPPESPLPESPPTETPPELPADSHVPFFSLPGFAKHLRSLLPEDLQHSPSESQSSPRLAHSPPLTSAGLVSSSSGSS